MIPYYALQRLQRTDTHSYRNVSKGWQYSFLWEFKVFLIQNMRAFSRSDICVAPLNMLPEEIYCFVHLAGDWASEEMAVPSSFSSYCVSSGSQNTGKSVQHTHTNNSSELGLCPFSKQLLYHMAEQQWRLAETLPAADLPLERNICVFSAFWNISVVLWVSRRDNHDEGKDRDSLHMVRGPVFLRTHVEVRLLEGRSFIVQEQGVIF